MGMVHLPLLDAAICQVAVGILDQLVAIVGAGAPAVVVFGTHSDLQI